MWVGHQLFDDAGHVSARLSGVTLEQLFESATDAFVETVTALELVEPRRAEEVDVDAPDLDQLLVDYLCELLYRLDTRGWLTRRLDVDVHEKDEGWTLEGTLRGERLDDTRHPHRAAIKAVSYRDLHVRDEGGQWTATVVFDVSRR